MHKSMPFTAKTLRQYQTHGCGNPIPTDVCPYRYLSHTKHTDYAVAGFVMQRIHRMNWLTNTPQHQEAGSSAFPSPLGVR